MVERVNGAQAKELVAGGATLLDVRTPEEFAGGAIDGAKNISVQTLPGRIAEVGDKDAPVIVYCRSGGRSANAAGILTQAGYSKVYDLGGIGNW